MLTLNQIKNIYTGSIPDNKHTLNILTEYIQCELLDSIFKNTKSNFLIASTQINMRFPRLLAPLD